MHLHWIAGHVKYKVNELADQAAKETAHEPLTLLTGPGRNSKQAKVRTRLTIDSLKRITDPVKIVREMYTCTLGKATFYQRMTS